MKKLFIAIMCVFVVTQLYAKTGDGNVSRVHFRTVKYNTNAGKSIHHAPYHGDAVTSSYDEMSSLLTLWFHYAAENAEVLITKNGETVAEETFDMSANELLECDFSECESGVAYPVVSLCGGERRGTDNQRWRDRCRRDIQHVGQRTDLDAGEDFLLLLVGGGGVADLPGWGIGWQLLS